MPTFVTLINWTDQGIKNAKDTVSRAQKANEAMAPLGVKLKQIYWTVGQYDIVSIVEADDVESATAALLALGAEGNIRSTTMLAHDADAMTRILGKLG